MSLEDAIKFWRTELTKKGEVDVDKFEKEYAYGIRYNYGKVRIQIRNLASLILRCKSSLP